MTPELRAALAEALEALTWEPCSDPWSDKPLDAIAPIIDAAMADGLYAIEHNRRDALLAAADDLDRQQVGPFRQQLEWAANWLRARANEGSTS